MRLQRSRSTATDGELLPLTVKLTNTTDATIAFEGDTCPHGVLEVEDAAGEQGAGSACRRILRGRLAYQPWYRVVTWPLSGMCASTRASHARRTRRVQHRQPAHGQPGLHSPRAHPPFNGSAGTVDFTGTDAFDPDVRTVRVNGVAAGALVNTSTTFMTSTQ